jgi:hypothetical protein
MFKLAHVAASITLEQTVQTLSLDGAALESCEGWFVPKHNLMMMFEVGREDEFLEHCIRRAGSISSMGQSATFGVVMRELHNDFQGDTNRVGPLELRDRGWIRFAIQAGKVTLYVGEAQALAMLFLLLFPYATNVLVLNDWTNEYVVEEPTESQVEDILANLNGVTHG